MSISVFLALLVLSCGYALARGGAPERVAALMQIVAYVASFVLHRIVDATDYAAAGSGTITVDILLLTGLTLLAWRSTRFWPLALAGWQLATVIAHLAKIIDPGMLGSGYAVQAQIWSYPMLVALAIGVWRHRRRLAAGDPDPSWKSQLI